MAHIICEMQMTVSWWFIFTVNVILYRSSRAKEWWEASSHDLWLRMLSFNRCSLAESCVWILQNPAEVIVSVAITLVAVVSLLLWSLSLFLLLCFLNLKKKISFWLTYKTAIKWYRFVVDCLWEWADIFLLAYHLTELWEGIFLLFHLWVMFPSPTPLMYGLSPHWTQRRDLPFVTSLNYISLPHPVNVVWMCFWITLFR